MGASMDQQIIHDLFTNLLWFGLGVAVALLLISPLLKRMMHGVH